MSEPMSNPEIEDVLSSIRRLVSEDLRPAARPAADPVPDAAAVVGEKLILTPALRVVEPAAPAVAEATGDAPPPVEEVVQRLGASVPEEEWESPFGDPEVWHDHAARDDVPTFVHRGRVADADDVPPEFNDAPMAPFAQVEDVLPEAGYDAAFEAGPADPVRAAPRKMAPPAQDDAAWADAAEAAAIADLAKSAEDDVIAGVYDGAAGGMTFDEEVLRDLVRDLIREELAGSLGERITRNVRKLVRAEIARALALRDFE